MAYIFCIFIHLLVLAAIIGMAFFLVHVIKDDHDATERLLRIVAFSAGLLAYLAAKAYGVAIPTLMVSALDVTKPLTLGFYGAVLPSLAGTFVAWFCLRLMKNDEDVGKRGLVLFASFIFTMFSDSYTTIASKITPSQSGFGLPNMTFVLGIVLYIIFNYQRDTTKGILTQQRKHPDS